MVSLFALACSDLPCDSQGSAPNSLVMVHIIVPGQQQLWVHHNHTEIADVSVFSSSFFLHKKIRKKKKKENPTKED
jgi:hypothetical protein